MKENELVPPLELCKLIPEGEFADSCLVYWGEMIVLRRSTGKIVTDEKFYPAPMLEEIFKALPESVKIDKWGGIHIYNDVQNGNGVSFYRGSTAAIKLWLKLKGIEDGE